MKQGTAWVKPGEGATIKELLSAEYPKGKEFEHITSHAVRNIAKLSEDDGHQTNLALTGEPINKFDLERMAFCE